MGAGLELECLGKGQRCYYVRMYVCMSVMYRKSGSFRSW